MEEERQTKAKRTPPSDISDQCGRFVYSLSFQSTFQSALLFKNVFALYAEMNACCSIECEPALQLQSLRRALLAVLRPCDSVSFLFEFVLIFVFAVSTRGSSGDEDEVL